MLIVVKGTQMSTSQHDSHILKTSNLTGSELVSFRKRLRHQARRWLGPKLRTQVDSSDLIQDTLAFTISRLSQLLGRSKHEVYRWMVSVLRFRVLNYAAMMKQRPFHGQSFAGMVKQEWATESDVVEEFLSAELRLLIDQEVEKLSPVSREIFLLHYVEGLKFSEIALRLNKSPASVRSSHHRLLEDLQYKIAKHVI